MISAPFGKRPREKTMAERQKAPPAMVVISSGEDAFFIANHSGGLLMGVVPPFKWPETGAPDA